jgi:flagellar hook-basal body complex protein FliE
MVDPVSSDILLQQMQEMQQSAQAQTADSSSATAEKTDEQFGDMFSKLINDVDKSQKEADNSIRQLATGDNNTSIQDVVFKLEQADVSFNMMKGIRDKLLEAYKEVMTMQS